MIPASLADFGPYEQSAYDLLEASARLDSSQQSLSPEHVLLAALPDPTTGQLTFSQSTLQWLRTAGDRQQLARLRRILQREIEAPSPRGPDDLARCGALWKQEAETRGVLITDALVVWAILADVNAASEALDLAFDKHLLQQDLEARFQLASGGAVGRSSQVPSYHDYLKTVSASPGFRYATEFDLFREDVVDRVNRCDDAEFVVVYGERGSPLRALKHIIADSLAKPGVRSETLGRVGTCRGVQVMSMASICRLSVAHAQAVLDGAIAMCRKEHEKQLLVLDHLEELQRHQADAHAESVNALVERLARLDSSEETIIGQYWLNQEEAEQRDDFDLNSALGMPDAVRVPAEEYTPDHTENALRTHFEPEWMRNGFAFTADSFDGLLLLEPAIAEKGNHPKLLPFLAIDVVQSVVDSLQRRRASTEAIRTWIKNEAYRGLDELNRIAKLAAPTQRVSNHFAAELDSARTAAQRLIANPELTKTRTKASDAAGGGMEALVLTRSLLVLALLADPDITFVYPSEAKLDRFLSRQPAVVSASTTGGTGSPGGYRSAEDVKKDGHKR